MTKGFLSYEAIVDRLEDAAKQLPGASVLYRDGLAILKIGAAAASDGNEENIFSKVV